MSSQQDMEVLERLKAMINSGQSQYYNNNPPPAVDVAPLSQLLVNAPPAEEHKNEPLIDTLQSNIALVLPARLAKLGPRTNGSPTNNAKRNALAPAVPLPPSHSAIHPIHPSLPIIPSGSPPALSPVESAITLTTVNPLPQDPAALAAELKKRREEYPERDRLRDERELAQRLREKARQQHEVGDSQTRVEEWAAKGYSSPATVGGHSHYERYPRAYPHDGFADRHAPPSRGTTNGRRVPAPIDRTVHPPIGVPPPQDSRLSHPPSPSLQGRNGALQPQTLRERFPRPFDHPQQSSPGTSRAPPHLDGRGRGPFVEERGRGSFVNERGHPRPNSPFRDSRDHAPSYGGNVYRERYNDYEHPPPPAGYYQVNGNGPAAPYGDARYGPPQRRGDWPRPEDQAHWDRERYDRGGPPARWDDRHDSGYEHNYAPPSHGHVDYQRYEAPYNGNGRRQRSTSPPRYGRREPSMKRAKGDYGRADNGVYPGPDYRGAAPQHQQGGNYPPREVHAGGYSSGGGASYERPRSTVPAPPPAPPGSNVYRPNY